MVAAALALAVALPLVLAGRAHVLGAAQVAASDLLFKTRGSQPARSTVIVGIDQRSYRALLPAHGPLSQWPRTLYARALDALRTPAPGAAAEAAAGPRVIAFGVFFDAPRPEDGELAEAMRRAGNVVTPVVAQGARDLDPSPGVAQRFDVFARPAPAIRGAASGEGLANVTVARDSVVRGLPLLLQAGDERVPSMTLTLAARYARRPAVLDGPPRPGFVDAAGRSIPVRDGDIMAINFLGPPSTAGGRGPVPIIPFADVLEGRFDRALVRDRIALIGPTILGVDEHPTPTTAQTRMWGIEILAHAVETVVHQRYLVPAPAWLTDAAIVALALLATALTALRSLWLGALGGLLLLAAYLTAAAVAFDGGIVLNLIYPPAALVGGFAVALAHRVVFAEKDRRLAREAMDLYLSPSVGRWVLADPRRLSLGGEVRDMTVLFMDLRQFTTLSHSLPPETLVALLNRYRAVMSDVVFAHDGVLVQFAGDAIEAFWNAPMDQPDHARRACRAALDIERGARRHAARVRGARMGARGSRHRHQYRAHGGGELRVTPPARVRGGRGSRQRGGAPRGAHQALWRARRRGERHARRCGRRVRLAIPRPRGGEGAARAARRLAGARTCRSDRPRRCGTGAARAVPGGRRALPGAAIRRGGEVLCRAGRGDAGRWPGGALPRAVPPGHHNAAPRGLGGRARRVDRGARAPQLRPSWAGPGMAVTTAGSTVHLRSASKLASVTRAVCGSLPLSSCRMRVASRSPCRTSPLISCR